MTEPQSNQQLTRLMPRGSIKGMAVAVLAFVLAYLLYLFLPFENDVNKGLAVLLFIAILWFTEAVHITVTALMVPIIAVVLGFEGITTKSALSNFADPVIFIFFGGFALATALHIQQLDRKIAYYLLSLSRGNLLLASLMIFAVTAFMSMWISNTATAAMMLPLALGVMSNLDRNTNRNSYVFVLLGVAYSASIGGLGTLVGSPPNAIAARELGMDFAAWMKIGLPMVIILLPLMIYVLWLVFRPNFKGETGSLAIKEDIEWTPIRLVTLVLFVFIALCWIFSSNITALLGTSSTDSLIAIFAAVMVVVLGCASWKDVADNTDWGVLLLFGGGITLSQVMQQSGASQVLGQLVADTFGGAHPLLVIFVICTFIIVLTEFTSNTASAALLVPVFAGVATQMNMPPEVLVLVIGIGASCAFMLPVATPPNAIVFGSGLIHQREMIRAGMVLNVLCVAAVSLFIYFFVG
ncbi:SLC13 family permease [Oligella urethralis]|uniref:SLC13 family permease n=1 Tax=Oligella urethralis TaxID=90245 RepID=UPI000D0103F1|nr:DASS family sodium-coupled anion symporter [Oligella urethralis]AVL71465.1 anion:sodium symporter [Oligella urethralis]SUA54320.1 Na(+)/dicarboxylate symporter [Oligella urethralis]